MRPDVTIISTYPAPGSHHAGRSGVSSYTANLARSLVGQGARVTVVGPSEDGAPPRYTDDGVDVRCGFGRGPLSLVRAAAAARATGAPVVHLQHEMFLFGGAAAAGTLPLALSLLRRSAPLAVTMHQVIAPEEIDRTFTRMHHVRTPPAVARVGVRVVNDSVARAADAVVVHEPHFRGSFEHATVVPHGVETRARPDRASARKRLGLTDRPVVLCFGFLAPYKGLEHALEAARHSEGAFDLAIAGANHPRAPAYGDALRAKWAGRARFTGFVHESDLPLWFAAADVALFPYPRPFSSSGAVALALAYGTPVLLSAPLAESMHASHDLIAPFDPPALARRLTSATSPRELAGLRSASDALARHRRWDVVARRHLELYEEVSDVARPAGRRVRAGQPG